MPFGLVWFGQANQAVEDAWTAARSPMPFGLVWFGQLPTRAKADKALAASPMPFGLVWFGQSKCQCALLVMTAVSNAFRLGLVWSAPYCSKPRRVAPRLQCLSAWSGLVSPRTRPGGTRQRNSLQCLSAWSGLVSTVPTMQCGRSSGVSNAFRLGLVWSDVIESPQRLSIVESPMPFGLVWFGQKFGLLSPSSSNRASPMPFGLVWFGQANHSRSCCLCTGESPMPFGLVWFGQTPLTS